MNLPLAPGYVLPLLLALAPMSAHASVPASAPAAAPLQAASPAGGTTAPPPAAPAPPPPDASRTSTPAAPSPQPAAPAGREAQDIGYLTADRLAGQCSNAGSPDISYCFAYLAAVHDTMRAYEIWLGEKEFCMPANAPQSELKQTFLTYITAYPENRQGQAASVIAMALRQTYPCADAK